jgi:chemotaxis family two-component system response regulator Rcp1
MIEVLWVEDRAEEIALVRIALQDNNMQHEFNLHFVYDGVQALEFLNNEGAFINTPRPDIIILDINMPRKNGKEVLAEIKKNNRLRLIPVIMLSSSSSEEDIFYSYQLHANCYLTKPFEFEKYSEVIHLIKTSG